MAVGKIIVFVAMLAIFLPSAEACFVSSGIEIDVGDVPSVPPSDSVTMDATVTFRWGFGSFIPLPVTIYFDINNVPGWLYASPSMHSFTVTPKGLTGGEEKKTITITLTSNKETAATYMSTRTAVSLCRVPRRKRK